MLKRVVLLVGIVLTTSLCWFAVRNYHDASAIAEENLRGVALSITSAVENIVYHDPSLETLEGLHPADMAFLALTDDKGIYRFHSNPDLIGQPVEAPRPAAAGETGESRVTLGTGEKAYQYITPIHLPSSTLKLHLTLHTYRADTVIRKAKLNMAILFSLLMAGWILSAVIYRFALREKQHQREMAHRKDLARLGEMGAMLAHEIRNPLAGIKGFAQVIGKKPMDERNSAFAGKIVAETLRLESLVFNLLSYARSGPISATDFVVCGLIEGAVALVRGEVEAKGVIISIKCPEDLRLSGDRDRLGQVMLNLLQNAVQAVSHGGMVDIVADRSQAGVTMVITDNGAGIGKEVAERIFEPFFTTKARGTGLGLAICKKIVEEHGGTIGVAGKPGRGAAITLTFPAAMAA
ncbi:sensor histidine kinase [Geotalea daltonii FRC-32]|uniref:histidine kinase n=1 Tax=Geotalea daltonii (strain DSM 22248 / JCM 15807 / FRC-32) TaxID=316067 RepID=B9M1R9_GEODF|nr:ATP-binding protein [Geotalea daltonii]ACM19215.1 sensor histidine kinase [Geotalea daltonii FRC-32]